MVCLEIVMVVSSRLNKVAHWVAPAGVLGHLWRLPETKCNQQWERTKWDPSQSLLKGMEIWFCPDFGAWIILWKWINKEFRCVSVGKRMILLFAEGEGFLRGWKVPAHRKQELVQILNIYITHGHWLLCVPYYVSQQSWQQWCLLAPHRLEHLEIFNVKIINFKGYISKSASCGGGGGGGRGWRGCVVQFG